LQLIETSALGVRSAWFRFACRDNGWSVSLYPMIHVGEPAFYEAVYRAAAAHDVVLVEGVRSAVSRHLTRTYRWSAKRYGLIVQPRFEAGPEGPRVVQADLSRHEFDVEWKRIPLWIRALVNLMVPFVALALRWSGTRESLAATAELEDRKSQREILGWNPAVGALSRTILDVRDQRLLERLAAILAEPADEGRSVAIVYGAAHMRAVLKELRRRGFQVVDSGWFGIFDL